MCPIYISFIPNNFISAVLNVGSLPQQISSWSSVVPILLCNKYCYQNILFLIGVMTLHPALSHISCLAVALLLCLSGFLSGSCHIWIFLCSRDCLFAQIRSSKEGADHWQQMTSAPHSFRSQNTRAALIQEAESDGAAGWTEWCSRCCSYCLCVLGHPCPSGAATCRLCKEISWYLVKAPRGLMGPWWQHILLHSCCKREQGMNLAGALPCHALDKTDGCGPSVSEWIPPLAETNSPCFKEKHWTHQDYQLNMFQWHNTSVNRKMEPMKNFLPAGGRLQNYHLSEGDDLSYVPPAACWGRARVESEEEVCLFGFNIYVPVQEAGG